MPRSSAGEGRPDGVRCASRVTVMTAHHRRVALVAAADDQRLKLARYLGEAGFEVHLHEELTVATSFGAVVWLAGDGGDGGDGGDVLVARVRSWLRSTRPRRIVVVTFRPSALRGLAAAHPERVILLPAPAFGWDLVDALRSSVPPGPRSA